MEIMLLLFSVICFIWAFWIIIQRHKGIVKYIPFKYIEGIESLAKGIDVKISFNENDIQIDNINLPISSIKKVDIASSKQLVESNNVIGNAIAGGLLFGGVGAIVGGMSGMNQTKTELVYFLTIIFNDDKFALFSLKNPSDRGNIDKAIKRINPNSKESVV
jgi:hypothetical protein